MSESLAPSDPAGKSVLIVESWGVLEWIYGHEPAMTKFLSRLEAAISGGPSFIASRITLGEETYNIRGWQPCGEISDERFDLSAIPWSIKSVDDALVDAAADLKSIYPISYADAVVEALARRYQAPVLTGDPYFQMLAEAGVVTLDWIGQ